MARFFVAERRVNCSDGAAVPAAPGGGMFHSGSGTVLRGRGAAVSGFAGTAAGEAPANPSSQAARFPAGSGSRAVPAARRHAEQLRLGQQFARVFEGGLGTFVAHHARQLLHAILG